MKNLHEGQAFGQTMTTIGATMLNPLSADKEMFSPAEIAAIFGVSRRTVLRWIAQGRLGGYRVSYTVRVARADLESFLSQHRLNDERKTTK